MKSRPFFKGLSWLLLLNLAIKPVWILLIDRQVQVLAGHEAYGRYFSVLSLSYLLVFLADAGISNMMNQQLAAGKGVHLSQLLRLKLLLSLVYTGAAVVIGTLTGISQWQLLFYVLAIQILNSFFVFARGIITAHQQYTADALFSVLDKVGMILVCGTLIYFPALFGGITLEIFLQVQVALSTLSLLLAFAFIGSKGWIVRGGEQVAGLARIAAPFAAVILLMSVHYRLDGFLLERMRPDGALQAGLYAAAYRILDVCNMIGYLTASFLVPFIARHRQEPEVVQSAVVPVRHGLLLFGIGAALFTFFFAPWMGEVLYGTSDNYSAQVMQLCLASLPGYLLVHIYSSWLTATGRLKLLVTILLGTVLLNATLNLLLIPRMGAAGAAIAAICSQWLCGAWCWWKAVQGKREGKQGLGLYLGVALLLTLYFYGARAAMLNVWLILALAVIALLLILARQIVYIKEFFIRNR